MAANVLVDAGFLVTLLSRRDRHHPWAAAEARRARAPWKTCDAVLSEAFHLLQQPGIAPLSRLLGRGALTPSFELRSHLERVLALMEKYGDVPMSLADGCLVCMTETLPDPLLLTTDRDFRVYRRHGRQVIPARFPGD
jgi:uncharacterized protein